MKLAEATRQALLILEEEQISPTVGYEFVSPHWQHHLQSLTDVIQSYSKPQAGGLNIYTMRQQRPRKVSETPKLYVFRSENYDYLRTIFEQVSECDRTAFIATLLELVPSGKSSRKSVERARFPHVSNSVSCLPLLAEFCIRTNYTGALLKSLQTITVPQVGVAVMLLQLEETIALNYDIFLESDLNEIPAALDNLYKVAELQSFKTKGPRGGKQVTNPHYRGGFEATGRQIIGAIDGIREECRKALFYYLRDGIKQRPNLQIEADKKIVTDYLTKLGFGPDMVGALNAAEVEYKSATNQFELKNCLGHLRSFLEHLHRESAKSIAAAAGDTVQDRWGKATLYLRTHDLITQQHESFVTSLYTLLSDESVHPLGAAPEYARLLRNVVIEYGVMFLSVLDKKGVTIR